MIKREGQREQRGRVEGVYLERGFSSATCT